MNYTVDGDKVYDENGNVALRYLSNTGKLVVAGGTEYLFRTMNNVCLSWVNPAHVSAVFAIRKNCCGNRLSQQFVYANEMHVRLWLGLSARP